MPLVHLAKERRSKPQESFKKRLPKRRNHLDFAQPLRRMALSLSSHVADLVVVITCLTVTTALFYKLAGRMDLSIPTDFFKNFSNARELLSLKSIAIITGVLYFCYLLYWTVFKIFGMRTLGKMFLTRPRIDSVTNEKQKGIIPETR